MLLTDEEVLFIGRINNTYGLSNALLLAERCPSEFQDHANPWHAYVQKLFENGGNIANWRCKPISDPVLIWRMSCFNAVAYTHALPAETRVAIMAWMLFYILEDAPQYVPPTDPY